MILLSFIIPAHQEEEQIAATVRSIFLNAFEAPIEILVIDDSSTDETAKKAREAGATVHSLNVKNRSKARNYGASLAKGKWLIFLDADVILDKNWSEHLNDIIQSPLKTVYQGPIIPEGDEGSLLRFRKFYSREKSDGTYCSFLTSYGIPHLNAACFIIKSQHFHEIGGFDESLLRCEDSDFGYRLIIEGFIFRVVPSMKSYVYWTKGFFAYLNRFYAHGKASHNLEQRWNMNSDKTFINHIRYALATPHPFLMSIIQLLIFLGRMKESFELKNSTPPTNELRFKIFLKNYLLPEFLKWKTNYKPSPYTRFICSPNETRVLYPDLEGQFQHWKADSSLSQLDHHLEKYGNPGGFISLPLA